MTDDEITKACAKAMALQWNGECWTDAEHPGFRFDPLRNNKHALAMTEAMLVHDDPAVRRAICKAIAEVSIEQSKRFRGRP